MHGCEKNYTHPSSLRKHMKVLSLLAGQLYSFDMQQVHGITDPDLSLSGAALMEENMDTLLKADMESTVPSMLPPRGGESSGDSGIVMHHSSATTNSDTHSYSHSTAGGVQYFQKNTQSVDADSAQSSPTVKLENVNQPRTVSPILAPRNPPVDPYQVHMTSTFPLLSLCRPMRAPCARMRCHGIPTMPLGHFILVTQP